MELLELVLATNGGISLSEVYLLPVPIKRLYLRTIKKVRGEATGDVSNPLSPEEKRKFRSITGMQGIQNYFTK